MRYDRVEPPAAGSQRLSRGPGLHQCAVLRLRVRKRLCRKQERTLKEAARCPLACRRRSVQSAHGVCPDGQICPAPEGSRAVGVLRTQSRVPTTTILAPKGRAQGGPAPSGYPAGGPRRHWPRRERPDVNSHSCRSLGSGWLASTSGHGHLVCRYPRSLSQTSETPTE